jgi:hypothetical protein
VIRALTNGLSQFDVLDNFHVHGPDMNGRFAKSRCL